MFENVTRIRFVMQKQTVRKQAQLHPERTPASYCRCSKYKRICKPGPIQRGEAVVLITRRVVMHTNPETGEKKGWYTNERWRVECLAEIMILLHQVFAMKNILQPLKKDLKRDRQGAPTSLKEVWNLTDQQIEQRARLQRRASTYRNRLNRYLKNLTPTERTLKAIENCKIKIQIAQTAIDSQLKSDSILEPGFQGEVDD